MVVVVINTYKPIKNWFQMSISGLGLEIMDEFNATRISYIVSKLNHILYGMKGLGMRNLKRVNKAYFKSFNMEEI